MKEQFSNNSPQYLAEELYYKFSEFETLNVEQVKKCCDITLKELMKSCDTDMRLYYDLARMHVKKRGTEV